MVSTLSKNWKDWPLPPILEDTVYANNPVGILTGLLKAAKIGRVAFHTAELDAAAKSWAAAAKSFPVDSMIWRECMEQSAKFAAWWREITDGQSERAEIGAMIIEPHDWPSKDLFERAIGALKQTQIGIML